MTTITPKTIEHTRNLEKILGRTPLCNISAIANAVFFEQTNRSQSWSYNKRIQPNINIEYEPNTAYAICSTAVELLSKKANNSMQIELRQPHPKINQAILSLSCEGETLSPNKMIELKEYFSSVYEKLNLEGGELLFPPSIGGIHVDIVFDRSVIQKTDLKVCSYTAV